MQGLELKRYWPIASKFEKLLKRLFNPLTIKPEEKFTIPYFQGDSDIIFADLDHDGDGKINFEDFSFGFRDFLTPGSRYVEKIF